MTRRAAGGAASSASVILPFPRESLRFPGGPGIRLQAKSPPDAKNAAAPDGVAAFLVREAGLEPARPE